MKPNCEHKDYNNNYDCENGAEYICMCCSSPTCQEHVRFQCPFGGMGYIEVE